MVDFCTHNIEIKTKSSCKKCYLFNYRNTPQGKSVRSRAQSRYARSEKGLSLYGKYRELGGFSESNKKYRESESGSSRIKVYFIEKRKNDIQYKRSTNLRRSLNRAIRGGCRGGLYSKYLGCTIDQLKFYIESRFKEGMSWDNYGQKTWHIDHLEPMCKFDLFNENDLVKVCHYSNLQPLWAKENYKKGKW